jgi:hypothetical protein
VPPHGNAEVERVFSTVQDIVTKKRSNLNALTVKALVVAKSVLSVKDWSSANYPINQTLLTLAVSAQASYQQRLCDEKNAEEERRREELEKSLLREVEVEKKRDKKLVKLTDEAEATALAIEKKRMQKLLEQAQEKARESDRELECLRQEKEALDRRAQSASARAVDNVLKRHSVTILSGSLSKRGVPDPDIHDLT